MQIATPLSDTYAIRKSENIVSRKVCESFFLIDIADNYSQDKCALYEINETGNFIWDHIDGERCVLDIASELQKAIVDDIDLQILVDDVREFIDALFHKKFIEV